ncbi:UNKNOWN [Stylonychia lemnae]|uniref:Uncharacterized protein n=1 Tax=Stylonychia lemnae TaxID=5949 RepID=A0A078A6Y7_STYLE|nr:UNKNOWN [Stylonychia lemnae]|eukprot:CDW78004.1 UNKNOWN [Stylonychia lemnae]
MTPLRIKSSSRKSPEKQEEPDDYYLRNTAASSNLQMSQSTHQRIGLDDLKNSTRPQDRDYYRRNHRLTNTIRDDDENSKSDYHALRRKQNSMTRRNSEKEELYAKMARDLFRENQEKDMELDRLRKEQAERDKRIEKDLERIRLEKAMEEQKRKMELDKLRSKTEFKLKTNPSDNKMTKLALQMLQDDQKNVDNLAQSLRNYLEYQNDKEKAAQARENALRNSISKLKKQKTKKRKALSIVNNGASYTQWTQGFSRKTTQFDPNSQTLYDPLNRSGLPDKPKDSPRRESTQRINVDRSMLLHTPEAPLLSLEKKISSIVQAGSNVQRKISTVSFADQSQNLAKQLSRKPSLNKIASQPAPSLKKQKTNTNAGTPKFDVPELNLNKIRSEAQKRTPYLQKVTSQKTLKKQGLQSKVSINSRQVNMLEPPARVQSAKNQNKQQNINNEASFFTVENLDSMSENSEGLNDQNRLSELINQVVQTQKNIEEVVIKGAKEYEENQKNPKLEVIYNEKEMELKKFLEMCTKHYKKCDQFVEELK